MLCCVSQASDVVGSGNESESNVTTTVTAQCRCAAGWHGARCQSRTTDTCEVWLTVYTLLPHAPPTFWNRCGGACSILCFLPFFFLLFLFLVSFFIDTSFTAFSPFFSSFSPLLNVAKMFYFTSRCKKLVHRKVAKIRPKANTCG